MKRDQTLGLGSGAGSPTILGDITVLPGGCGATPVTGDDEVISVGRDDEATPGLGDDDAAPVLSRLGDDTGSVPND
jgi:hypothetical protein